MIIAIDTGKHTTKALDARRTTFSVRTQLDDSPLLPGGGYAVEYDGRSYVIGAGASDYDITKTKLCHKLTAYMAVALLAQDPDVDLVIGCPVTQFINKAAREEHAAYFRGRVSIKINDTPHNFTVASVMVLPETIGAVMSGLPEYASGVIGVIDVGGLNVNACVYDRLKPVRESAFSMNEGGSIIAANIKRALNTATLSNYQDYEIPHVRDSKARPVVDSVLERQMDRIIEEAKKFNWNVSALPVVFSGGGSLLLERQIRANGWAISKDPIWDNVKGFMKFKEMYQR